MLSLSTIDDDLDQIIQTELWIRHSSHRPGNLGRINFLRRRRDHADRAQQSAPNEVEKAVEVALRAGYRHIDAAAIYQNEPEVGRGIKASGVPREEIFITSKLWNNSHRPEDVEAALNRTLSDLGTSYLDLYLIHWPVNFARGDNYFPRDGRTGSYLLDPEVNLQDTWRVLEKMVENGKVRSIGLSNFREDLVKEILSM